MCSELFLSEVLVLENDPSSFYDSVTDINMSVKNWKIFSEHGSGYHFVFGSINICIVGHVNCANIETTVGQTVYITLVLNLQAFS